MKMLPLLLFPLALFAQPQGLDVQRGTAQMRMEGKDLHIENSSHAILHWQEFSIGKGESVHFAQEQSKSTVLNRVTSSQSSHLLGRLTSNGAVFLINPNGVLIGAEAHIQTAGFLASTADIINEHFCEGHYLFSSPGEGAIINNGKIICPQGDIYLLAKTVENTGELSAQNISLISAHEVLISPHSNKKVAIRLELEEREVVSLTQDLQTTNPYEKAIHHSGRAEAFGTTEEKGRIYLVAQKREAYVSGTVNAESGEVHVLGDTVHLAGTAEIDVSGDQGGILLVGGDYQGKNPEILNAQTVAIERGAIMRADGSKGNGGKAIFWGDQAMHFQGEVTAQALGESGDGGFVEISSPGEWDFNWKVNASARQGKSGTLYLDPSDINISGGATSNAFDPPLTYDPTVGASPYTLNATDLSNALQSSGNVIIATASGVGGSGTVTFSSPVSWSSDNILTVNADQSILINNTIQNTSLTASGAVIVLNANTGGTTLGAFTGITVSRLVSTDSGGISVNGVGGSSGAGSRGIVIPNANGVIRTVSGDIVVQGTARTTGADGDGIFMNLGASIRATGSGNVSVTGVSSPNGTDNGQGIQMGNDSFISVESGMLTVTGTGNGTGTGNHGINVGTNSDILANTSGSIHMVGESYGFGASNVGVIVAGGGNTNVQSNTGTIHIEGRGSPNGTGGGTGVSATNGGKIRSLGGGFVEIIAEGKGGGSSNVGTFLNQGGIISTTGNGNLTLTTSGSSSGIDSNLGLNMQNNSVISVEGGVVTIQSTGNGSGNGNGGIVIGTNSDVFANTSGSIHMVGESYGFGIGNLGVIIAGGASGVISNTGNVHLEARGSPNGTGSCGGISITNGADVRSSGGGFVEIIAEGKGGGSNNVGTFMNQGGIISTVGNGNLSLTTSGSSSGIDTNYGLNMQNNSVISGAGGVVTILSTGNGQGNTNNGINIGTNSDITITTGLLDIKGYSFGQGIGNGGFFIVAGSSDIRSTSGNIHLEGNGSPNGVGSSFGGVLNNSAEVSSSSGGSIFITGTGAGGGGGNIGLSSNGALIQTTGGGNITIAGTGSSNGTTGNEGIITTGVGMLVSCADGTITMTGEGGTASTGINMTGGQINTTGTGSIVCMGTGEARGIALSGAATDITTASGSIALTGTGGGTGINADGIQITSSATVLAGGSGQVTLLGTGSPTGGGSSRGIFLSGSGSLVQSNMGNITLTGTGGNNSTDNHGLFVSGGADILSTSGTIQGQSRGGNGIANNYGILVTGNGTSIVSDSGGINLAGIAGGGTLEGIHIDAIGSAVIEATTSGLLQLTTPNNLFVGLGGTVRSLGTATQFLRAGVDIFLATGSTVSTNTGNLTLVVDNNYPTPFVGFGSGAFTLQAGATLTSGGQLRIYTATQSQNTVSAFVNGVPFIPGPFDMDTAQEQWSIYFPAGTYGGNVFKFYYKDPVVIPPSPFPSNPFASSGAQQTFSQNIAANLVQLPDLLPILKNLRAPTQFPNYHFEVCVEDEEEKECSPNFSPYGSFIFEDALWWVGESF